MPRKESDDERCPLCGTKAESFEESIEGPHDLEQGVLLVFYCPKRTCDVETIHTEAL